MSNLTTTSQHPLMGLPSPEENYPDLVSEVTKKLCIDDTNHLYEKQQNTSKNNLFFSEKCPPDVAKCETTKREFYTKSDYYIKTDERVPNNKEFLNDGPILNKANNYNNTPRFDLSIPLDTNVHSFRKGNSHSLESLSTHENDRSLYQAYIDPYKGSVHLLQNSSYKHDLSDVSIGGTRRKIKVPVHHSDDEESLSGYSMNSEEVYDLPKESECIVSCNAPVKEEVVVNGNESDDDNITLSEYSEPIPEYSAAEERADERAWLKVTLANGETRTVDMKVIEPYKRVLSHGGYSSSGAAVIVFSACYLPDCSRVDYDYVMDNLLFYILWTLERLVTDEYVLVYLHGSAETHRLPRFKWLRKSYYLIDRRLRKSLKQLYLVHPTLWLKSLMWMSKPFISSKFYRKVSYVKQLSEIMDTVPIQPAAIPDKVKHYDKTVR